MSGKSFEFGITISADGKVAVTTFKQVGAEGKAAGEKIAEGSRAAAQATAAATKAQDQYTLSAKQMQAAMRGVPAQFTDIVTAIQGGQNPMTVLLQQGGQLKDMFGGIGPAARALGGYVAGLVNPYTLAAAAVGGLTLAYYQGAKESDAYTRSLILTGNAAGTTATQMAAAARSVAIATAATQGAVADALAQAIAAGLPGAALNAIADAAVRMEQVTGKATGDTVAEFAKLAKDPVAASAKLNEQYNYLTESTYRQIKALEDQGRHADAAALAMKAYADAVASRSGEIVRNLGPVEDKWLGIKAAAASALDAVFKWRPSDEMEKAADNYMAIQARIRELSKPENRDRDPYGTSAELVLLNSELQTAKAVMVAARDKANASAAAAEAEEARAERVKAGIEFDLEGSKLLDRKAQMEREIARQRQLGIAAGRTEEEIQKRIAAIREKFTEKKARRVDNGLDDAAREQAKAYAQQYEALDKLVGGMEAEQAAGEKLLPVEKALAEARRTLSGDQLRVLELRAKDQLLIEARTKAEREAAEAAKIHTGYIQSQIAPLEEHALRLEQEVATYGLSASQIEAVALARLQEARDMAAANGAFPEHLAFLDREIEARRRLVAAANSKEALDANKKATEEMQRDWERMHEQLSQSLTDELMRGGKTAGELMENYFKTLVLRPVIQGAVSIGMNAVGSALGFSGAGSSSGSNLFSAASGVNNLLGGASAAYNTVAYQALGSMGAEQAAMLAAQDAVFGTAGTAATLEAAGASAFASTIGTALPWIGGAIAVGSMLGLFDGGGDDPHNNPQASGFHMTLSKAGVSGAAGLASPSSFLAGPTSGAGWWGDNTPLSAAQIAAIDKQTAAAFAQGHALALSLGVDPALADKASVISTLHGGGGNGAIVNYFASVEQAMTALADAIAYQVVPNLDEFQATGESLAQTAARLSQEFALTNKMATLMGRDAATAFGANNLKARDALIQSLGGLSGATTTFDSYYRNYHSEAERRADTQGNIAATLRAIGIGNVPTNRDEFRSLVEGQDLATESGRSMYATLLSVADAFAGITESADAAAKALAASMGTDRFRTRADYRYAQRTGVLPAYADGGDHGGGWAVVGEVGPEIAWMPPSRIYSNTDSKALLDLSQVTQAIDDLRADLRAANAAIARAANRTAKTLDKWEEDGMPLTRV